MAPLHVRDASLVHQATDVTDRHAEVLGDGLDRNQPRELASVCTPRRRRQGSGAGGHAGNVASGRPGSPPDRAETCPGRPGSAPEVPSGRPESPTEERRDQIRVGVPGDQHEDEKRDDQGRSSGSCDVRWDEVEVVRCVEQHEGDGYEDGHEDDHDSIVTKGCHGVAWTSRPRRWEAVRALWCRCAEVEERE